MNHSSPMSFDALFSLLDDRLGGDEFAHDMRLMPLIALDFCKALEDGLDREQKEAIREADVALANDSPVGRSCIDEFAKRIDADLRNKMDHRAIAINRLVWIAIGSNTGLSGYAAEFLVEAGKRAGLSIVKIYGILCGHIPGLEKMD